MRDRQPRPLVQLIVRQSDGTWVLNPALRGYVPRKKRELALRMAAMTEEIAKHAVLPVLDGLDVQSSATDREELAVLIVHNIAVLAEKYSLSDLRYAGVDLGRMRCTAVVTLVEAYRRGEFKGGLTNAAVLRFLDRVPERFSRGTIRRNTSKRWRLDRGREARMLLGLARAGDAPNAPSA